MSELIPSCSWTDLVKIVKEGRTEELKSCQVNFNGSLIFTAIIPHGDYIAKDYVRIQSEYLALKSNIGGGVSPEELTTSKTEYPNLIKAREARKAKLEARVLIG